MVLKNQFFLLQLSVGLSQIIDVDDNLTIVIAYY